MIFVHVRYAPCKKSTLSGSFDIKVYITKLNENATNINNNNNKSLHNLAFPIERIPMYEVGGN